jgi:hypothetical protein
MLTENAAIAEKATADIVRLGVFIRCSVDTTLHGPARVADFPSPLQIVQGRIASLRPVGRPSTI